MHGVQELLHARTHLLRPRRAAASLRVDALVRGPDEVVQVGALGAVELQGPADAFEHRLGDAFGVAAFEPGVVLDAHPGDQGDFFAAEPGHAASAAEVGQADLFGGEPGPPCGQELPDVVRSVHATESTSATAPQGVPGVNRIGRVCLVSASRS